VTNLDSHQDIGKAFADLRERFAAMTFPHALRSGDRAPSFELPDAAGERERLTSLLEEGPIVLVFYRGSWCPYCNTQLRGLQTALGQIKALGATLVAVSPQVPDASAAFATEAGLGFPVLSDVGSYVASDYGITFELSEVDRNVFLRAGNDLSKMNGPGTWILPAPSTYVIAEDAHIEYAHIDPNFAARPDVGEVLAVLRAISSLGG
jgi:peroxiredoxin